MFTTNGCIADYILLFCLTKPEEKDPHKSMWQLKV